MQWVCVENFLELKPQTNLSIDSSNSRLSLGRYDITFSKSKFLGVFSPSFRQKSLAERLNAALWRHRWAWLAGTGPGIPDQNVSFAWVRAQELVNLAPMHRHVNGKMVINHGSFWVLYFQTNPIDFQDFASRAYHRNTSIYFFSPRVNTQCE